MPQQFILSLFGRTRLRMVGVEIVELGARARWIPRPTRNAGRAAVPIHYSIPCRSPDADTSIQKGYARFQMRTYVETSSQPRSAHSPRETRSGR
jgi:hypothetical protein